MMETWALVCLTFSTQAPCSHVILLICFIITDVIFAILQKDDHRVV